MTVREVGIIFSVLESYILDLVAELFGHHRKGSFPDAYERVSPFRLSTVPTFFAISVSTVDTN